MRPTHRRLIAAGLIAGFLGGLATCQDTLGRERVAVCRRALPAVAQPAEVRLLRAGPGPAPGTVRVDYEAGSRRHWLLCRFGSGTDLVALTTEAAALSDAALYMLKRFYLDTPDAAAADPGTR
ncbi:hypothetical protein Q8W71_00360 [Methylobacterium sp. NEAU 140]|uniref:hypothetical protein n=1 Tax=Methylobacterium sp. NEAU 140 TaxID=3064945 RepID=UPI0027365485|nr:hypothetical protein [Methylobacterium sp. NEAU 140]MDP4021061.1 hypothetical protein [Methylobacterium sp. NEAU 140]